MWAVRKAKKTTVSMAGGSGKELIVTRYMKLLGVTWLCSYMAVSIYLWCVLITMFRARTLTFMGVSVIDIRV